MEYYISESDECQVVKPDPGRRYVTKEYSKAMRKLDEHSDIEEEDYE